jgi:hypothetical protein
MYQSRGGSMNRRFRNDAGNPFQPGNAIKNKNFDKAFLSIHWYFYRDSRAGLCCRLLYVVLTGAGRPRNDRFINGRSESELSGV